jgi:hypothetical protein
MILESPTKEALGVESLSLVAPSLKAETPKFTWMDCKDALARLPVTALVHVESKHEETGLLNKKIWIMQSH